MHSVYWNPSSERMLSGSWDGMARVWDVESDETVLGSINAEYQIVLVVAYSPDCDGRT